MVKTSRLIESLERLGYSPYRYNGFYTIPGCVAVRIPAIKQVQFGANLIFEMKSPEEQEDMLSLIEDSSIYPGYLNTAVVTFPLPWKSSDEIS